LAQYFDSFLPWRFKIEVNLVVWPGYAFFLFVLSYFPSPNQIRWLLPLSVIVIVGSWITLILDMAIVSAYLFAYQAGLVFFVILSFGYCIRGLKLKMPNSRIFTLSFLPLIIAMVNDIYASRISGYDFYITEYALFLFLFLQNQILNSRFVLALTTSEHLTANLKSEVNEKTKELYNKNLELEYKAKTLKAKHEQVKLLSKTDHLTGLFNRQTLEEYSTAIFNQSVLLGQPLSVAMMDLDHFKDINDKYGHLVGDECLIFVASYLRGFNLRKRDLIARYGGEEMLILFVDTPLKDAYDIAQRICIGLPKQSVEGDHEDIRLTASFGLSDIISTNAESIEDVIKAADEALYKAKKNGRNRVEIYQSESSGL